MLLYHIIRSVRPRQWLKNVSVFAAPVFFGNFFNPGIFLLSLKAFIAFCFIAASIYLINDIVDAPKDRLHPVKKNRPIASGKVSENLAWVLALGSMFVGIFYSVNFIGTFFSIAAIGYIILQLLYSLFLRNVIILDALTVATGFVVRVFAGGLAVSISISSWLILATIGLSLLLAFGKRRSEKTLLSKYENEKEHKTRKTLRHYPDSLLDSMISTSSSFCIITYALFTFQVSPQAVSPVLANFLPSILSNPKWMMLTIPMVIYGVARYLYVIYEKKEGESPARVLLSDKPLLATVILWGISILGITYLFPVVS
ncbi:MAG: decaprenyl-phosphate phosphoribosyltransferase [Patescibacteria group bacterium]